MGKDILSMYGPDSPSNQRPRASGGGEMPVRDVHNYQPPKGPTNIMDPDNPGLHGHNCGNCGTQQASSIHSDGGARTYIPSNNHGLKGSQR